MGLRLADVAALEAPWFLDRDHTEKYQAAVFANNALLANALADRNNIFQTVAHPILDCACGVAPFCVLRLEDEGRQAYERLEQLIKDGARQQKILFEQGGSFGFRGHRFEVVQPDDQAAPFLRVAIGRRVGWSLEGIIFAVKPQECGPRDRHCDSVDRDNLGGTPEGGYDPNN